MKLLHLPAELLRLVLLCVSQNCNWGHLLQLLPLTHKTLDWYYLKRNKQTVPPWICEYKALNHCVKLLKANQGSEIKLADVNWKACLASMNNSLSSCKPQKLSAEAILNKLTKHIPTSVCFKLTAPLFVFNIYCYHAQVCDNAAFVCFPCNHVNHNRKNLHFHSNNCVFLPAKNATNKACGAQTVLQNLRSIATLTNNNKDIAMTVSILTPENHFILLPLMSMFCSQDGELAIQCNFARALCSIEVSDVGFSIKLSFRFANNLQVFMHRTQTYQAICDYYNTSH